MEEVLLAIETQAVRYEFFKAIKLLLLLLLIFSLFVFPIMFLLSGWTAMEYTSVWSDQKHTHLPQINYYISHPFDLFNNSAPSATLPGHHLFLAYTSILLGITHVSQNTWAIRIFNVFFAYGFLSVA